MPYKLADKAIYQLNKLAVQRFSKITYFDEFNVIQEVKTLYQRLDTDNRKKFLELYIAKYREVREDILEELLEMELAGLLDEDTERLLDWLFGEYIETAKKIILSSESEKQSELEQMIPEVPEEEAKKRVDKILSEPNNVTHYAYEAEVPRKRDRLTEAVNSTIGVANKKSELKKGLKYWSRMTGWYTDIVSDDANVAAMEDSGVEYVMWNTQDDEKVCKVCRDRDQKIYPIHDIPTKPHPNCRCYMTRVRKA